MGTVSPSKGGGKSLSSMLIVRLVYLRRLSCGWLCVSRSFASFSALPGPPCAAFCFSSSSLRTSSACLAMWSRTFVGMSGMAALRKSFNKTNEPTMTSTLTYLVEATRYTRSRHKWQK